ncbi:hypothetical protein [Streptomyces mutabilis]|uniref:hypothetical protein n=1 Tax=Streptomyces mutabilis TaxID=67332 RepID=UPI0008FBA989|nr:hypothetical protein [Streptomyces mutabilis]
MAVAEETPRPAAAQPPVLDKRRRNVVFVTVMLGLLLAALDQTTVGTALPTIARGSAGRRSDPRRADAWRWRRPPQPVTAG